MSIPPDDQDRFPPHEQPTLDDLEPLAEAANDAQPHPSVIPAGFAVFAFSQALDRLHAAMREVEEIGMAAARQLDFQALPGKAGEP